jgi:hypothetical protein
VVFGRASNLKKAASDISFLVCGINTVDSGTFVAINNLIALLSSITNN